MKLYVDDFVNRVEILTTIRQMAAGANGLRLIQLGGPDGIGKSYLLDESVAGFDAEQIAYVRLNFGRRSWEQGYISVVLYVWEKLGLAGSEELSQVTRRTLSSYAETLAGRPPRSAPPAAEAAAGGDSRDVIQATIAEGQQGLIAVGKNIQQVQENFYLVIQYDDPWIQAQIRAETTRLFRQALMAFSNTRPVVFLIDDWDQATHSLREWMQESLLGWILDKVLTQAVAVVMDNGMLQFDRHPRRIARDVLSTLAKEDIRTYWIEKRRLPEEKFAQFVEVMGIPLSMAMIAAQIEQSMKRGEPSPVTSSRANGHGPA